MDMLALLFLIGALFTQLDVNGLDGMFDARTAEELVTLIRPLQPAADRVPSDYDSKH